MLGRYCELNETKQEAIELITQANNLVEEQKSYLNHLQFNDKDIAATNERVNEFITKLELEREDLKLKLFANRILKFEINKTPMNENLLGNLIATANKASLTVTIKKKFFL